MSKQKLYVDLRVSMDINDYELAQNQIDESVKDGFKIVTFCKTIGFGDRSPQKMSLDKIDSKGILVL